MKNPILTLQITPTPEPESAELIEQAVRVIDIWNSLGPLMAVLGVVALALMVVLLISYSNRNSNATAINVLAASNLQKDKDINDLQAQRKQDHEQHIESLLAIHAQGQRSNDLFEAMNNRGAERDKQQQQMVESQAKIAEDLRTMVSVGSKPVQDISTRVHEIIDIVKRIDSRGADWTSIFDTLTPLLTELGALRTEAKTKSQPIPIIDPVPETIPESHSL